MNGKSFGKFLEEFGELDLTPEIAICAVYGRWNYDPYVAFGTFNAKNYLRYTEEARKAVIMSVALHCREESCESKEKSCEKLLQVTCYGLLNVHICKKVSETENAVCQIIEELELWKEWGIDENLIKAQVKAVCHSVVHPFYKYRIDGIRMLMDYAHIRLSKAEALAWKEDAYNTYLRLTQEIADFIDKYTDD